MSCPSLFELSRCELAAAPPPALLQHVEGCRRCTEAMISLADARAELLGSDPAAASALAARRITAAATERRRPERAWWRWLPVGLVPVAAAVLFLSVPRERPLLDEPTVRTKGALAVEAYCKRGERVFPVAEGADFFPGDRLRFAYTKAEPGYLVLFGVDDAGQVFPYYQEGTLAAVEARPGSRVMLPGSVELDEHHGWERVFALWSPRPVAETAVRHAVALALREAGGDIRKATRLALEADQVSFLLRRP